MRILHTVRNFNPLDVVGWTVIVGIAAVTSSVLADAAVPNGGPFVPVAPIRVAHAFSVASYDHVPMPEEVRGFYMTSHSAATPKIRQGLWEYAKRNDLNAVVIDIKDFGGQLAFASDNPDFKPFLRDKPTIPELDLVLKEAKEAGLYRIARQFVFQDPLYAHLHPDQAVINKHTRKVWTDFKGVSWVDPASKAAWAYNAEVAKEMYARGFDEIQLDYIRFPSDGTLSTMGYTQWDGKTPKHIVMRDFYAYMHDQLGARGIPLSLDLFGYVTWYRDNDLGIGQLMAHGLAHSTAISAMVYPSHYGAGAAGVANPASEPYKIVAVSLEKANSFYRDIITACDTGVPEYVVSGTGTTKIAVPCDKPLAHQRPWLQAFDIGAVYTKDKINAQIQAVRDKGGKGWLLWNARNVYRDIK